MTGTPIRRLSRRVAAENSRWRVYLDHVRDAAGREVPDYLVVEPKVTSKDFVTGVAVLPIIGERIVLLPMWRHAIEAQDLELVKGFIDQGEEPSQAAMRELAEETGLTCDASDLEFVTHIAPEPSTLAGKGALFLARNCRPGPRLDDDDLGLGQPEHFTAAQVRTLLETSAIADAMTQIACLHWLSRR